MTWSLKHIEALKASGKIRDYRIPHSKPITEDQTGGRKVAKHFPKRSKAKDWIGWNLLFWCNEHAVILEEEYKFHPERKWRFDWCVPTLKIAIEFEGGIHDRNGSHTSIKDINRDMEKYNAAASLGWKVLRFSAVNYKSLIDELKKCL
jgi:very-short-patch-repair endonuclease